jgi:hypothetical protein
MLTPTPDGRDSPVTSSKIVGIPTYRKFVLALATIGVVAGVATIGFVLVPSTSSKVPSNAEEATISTALRAQEHASEIKTSEVQENVLTTTNGDDLDPGTAHNNTLLITIPITIEILCITLRCI